MFSRPFGDNPHAYASLMRLPPQPHPTQASNRFAQPKTSAATYEGASAPPQEQPSTNAFAQPASDAPQSLPSNPPPPGGRIDVYA